MGWLEWIVRILTGERIEAGAASGQTRPAAGGPVWRGLERRERLAPGSPREAARRYSLSPQAMRDRADAQEWARRLLARRDWVVVDTETTGLDGRAEVIQLGVLAADGSVVLNTLVRPQGRIPREATAIHGITEADTAKAPTYPRVHDALAAAITGKSVVSYNAEFDHRMLRQTASRYGLRPPPARWECAMLQYARYVGEWDARHGDYKWQKLPGRREHSAVADCHATLALLEQVAAG